MALAFGLHSLGGVGTLAGGVIPGSIGATTFFSSLTGNATRVYGAASDNTAGIGFDTGSGSITIRLASAEWWRFSGATGGLTSTNNGTISTGGSVAFATTSGSTVNIGNTTGAQTFGSNGACGMGITPNALAIWGSGSLTLAHLTTATVGVQTQMGTSATNALAPGTANVNTTSTASGAGASDMTTYAFPANALSANGKGVRIRAWGTTANNANAKTVALVFGGTTLISKQLTVSIAGFWEIEAVVFRTGSSAQSYEAKATNSGGTTVSSTDGATVLMQMNVSTCAETDTAGITIKGRCTVATSASDIVQKGMVVEFFN